MTFFDEGHEDPIQPGVPGQDSREIQNTPVTDDLLLLGGEVLRHQWCNPGRILAHGAPPKVLILLEEGMNPDQCSRISSPDALQTVPFYLLDLRGAVKELADISGRNAGQAVTAMLRMIGGRQRRCPEARPGQRLESQLIEHTKARFGEIEVTRRYAESLRTKSLYRVGGRPAAELQFSASRPRAHSVRVTDQTRAE